ncbi:hypothetical protein [Pseudomonas lini]
MKLARLLFLKQNTTFRESAELSLRSVTELFARFCLPMYPMAAIHPGTVPGWDSPFLRFTSSKEREKNGFSQLHKSVASK